jgi:CheY-like chemotaxis protein
MYRDRFKDCSRMKKIAPKFNDIITEKIKILLVEDNQLNQELTKAILEEYGFETDIAHNGSIAIDMVLKNRYDLILMDILMPEMDGYEATRRIRANGSIKQIPIIAMSAHAISGIKNLVMEAGMNDYIGKPFHVPEMIETIMKWIR